MKKNKALRRSYVFMYIMWLFGSIATALLFYRLGLALFIVLLTIVAITLGLLITGHVYYEKNYKNFVLIGGAGICLFNIINIIGLIVELVYTIQGKPATYAWVMLGLTLLSQILIDVFFYLDIKKAIDRKNHPELYID
jgi:hypothetical protein